MGIARMPLQRLQSPTINLNPMRLEIFSGLGYCFLALFLGTGLGLSRLVLARRGRSFRESLKKALKCLAGGYYAPANPQVLQMDATNSNVYPAPDGAHMRPLSVDGRYHAGRFGQTQQVFFVKVYHALNLTGLNQSRQTGRCQCGARTPDQLLLPQSMRTIQAV